MTLLKYAPGYSNKILDEKSGKEHCKTNTQIHKYAPGSQEPDKNKKITKIKLVHDQTRNLQLQEKLEGCSGVLLIFSWVFVVSLNFYFHFIADFCVSLIFTLLSPSCVQGWC